VQQELILLHDALAETGGTLLVTAARAPGQWERLCLPLRDRLSGGLCVPLRPPGPAARLAILEYACARRGVALSSAEAERLARRPTATPRTLWGLAVRLERASQSVTDASPGTTEGRRAEQAPTCGLKGLVAAAARYFGVSQTGLTGPSRRSSLVRARGITIRVARLSTSASLAEIGRALGGRDHTTVLHAERKILELASADSSIQYAIDELQRIVRGH
jgi:chromosomal replication initiator protein